MRGSPGWVWSCNPLKCEAAQFGWEDLTDKLEALEMSATEKLKDLSDTSATLVTKVPNGWMKGRDDLG